MPHQTGPSSTCRQVETSHANRTVLSPNQTALWTICELRKGAVQRHDRVLLRVVNGGHSCRSPAQVRTVEHCDPPILQAGHAGFDSRHPLQTTPPRVKRRAARSQATPLR
jgi:hypothetical protein